MSPFRGNAKVGVLKILTFFHDEKEITFIKGLDEKVICIAVK